MKVNTNALALASIIAAANAAPLILTRVVTAPAITNWVTVTTGAVVKTHTNVVVLNTPPPPPPPADPTTTSTTPTTTTSPTTVAATTTSLPTTTSTTTPTTATTPTTTATTPTTTSTTPTTTSTTPTTTSTTPTTTSTTPTTTSTTPTTTSTTSTTSPTTAPTTTSATTTTQQTTSSTTQQGDAFTSDVQFESDILDAHNQKRALHGVPSLVWSNTLSTYAANYAASNFDCNNVQLIHSGGPYGENLAAGYPGGYNPVDAWYNEISQYNFAEPGFSEATGHFTQVVWKSTSQLGCARVTCDNAWGQYTICEYSDTRGNIVGTDPATGLNFFTENVVPPLSSS